MPNFRIHQKDKTTLARLGEVELRNGTVQTPVFMPVGTHGAVRGISSFELKQLGSEIMLANTYHLFAKPGVDLISNIGGLHNFTSWRRPILTDSGGFQVFSLAENRKITEEGVKFKNARNGDMLWLSPEKVIDVQEKFGSDIMMVLDECPPPTATISEVQMAVDRTTRWAKRAREARTRKDLAMFPIFQGGTDVDLRRKSLRDLLSLEVSSDPWEGIAIGGLSVGEEKSKFVSTLFEIRNELPTDRPRYLMGVGTPRDLIFAVACGVDMFDCVLPSRNGRHGIVMTRHGRMTMFNAKHATDDQPLDPTCECPVCTHYTRSFIRHLFSIEDTLAGRLCTLHNISYFLTLMKEIRGHIANGTFLAFANEFMDDQKNVFLGSEKGFEKYPEAFI